MALHRPAHLRGTSSADMRASPCPRAATPPAGARRGARRPRGTPHTRRGGLAQRTRGAARLQAPRAVLPSRCSLCSLGGAGQRALQVVRQRGARRTARAAATPGLAQVHSHIHREPLPLRAGLLLCGRRRARRGARQLAGGRGRCPAGARPGRRRGGVRGQQRRSLQQGLQLRRRRAARRRRASGSPAGCASQAAGPPPPAGRRTE